MKRSVNEVFVAGFIVIAIIVTGCGQPESMDVKMSRIVAADNMQLKEQLRKSDWEIQTLKDQHAAQVAAMDKLIAQYKEQVQILEQQSRQNIRDQVKDILDVILERNAALRKEIEALKEDNAKLKIELEEQKKKAASRDEL